MVDFGVEMSRTTARPLAAELGLEAASGAIVVSGMAAVAVWHSCNRCLTEWEEEMRLDLLQPFSTSGEDEYTVEDSQIDVEPLLRDEVTLALPVAPLCRDDCAGLCPTCGSDLNYASCGCPESEVDSPFAGLRDLLELQE